MIRPGGSRRRRPTITDSTAEISSSPSGAVGVGTQTRATSVESGAAGSAVKRRLSFASPARTACSTPGSKMGERPAVSVSIRRSSTSWTTTVWPSRAKTAAVVRPTYPAPTTNRLTYAPRRVGDAAGRPAANVEYQRPMTPLSPAPVDEAPDPSGSAWTQTFALLRRAAKRTRRTIRRVRRALSGRAKDGRSTTSRPAPPKPGQQATPVAAPEPPLLPVTEIEIEEGAGGTPRLVILVPS